MYYELRLDMTPEEVIDYLRKSRSDDPLLTVEEVLAKHEAMLDEWAEKNLGGKVPEENKFREVVSGETLKERPEINKVLRLIESPKYKAVKVVEPQRLTRGDLEDIGRLMKLLKHTNTLVITPQRVYDLRDEYDWDAFERELKRGNDYLEYTKKILNRGRLLSVSQGNYIGTYPPYGFDKTYVMDGKKKCPTLKEKKEEADAVRLIFDLYVNHNLGRKRICDRLESLGIKPPKGEFWSPNTISNTLDNVHYIGKVQWNKYKKVTIVENGEIIVTRPLAKDGEWLIFEGKHDGIIPEELFYAAKEKRGRSSREKFGTKIKNPFASLLFCRCGRALIMRSYNHKDGKQKSQTRLVCGGRAHCNSGSCLATEIVDRVCDVLEKCIEDFTVKVENGSGDSAKLHAELVKNLEKKLKDLQARELSQWEAQSDPDPANRMPQEIFKKLNAKLQKEKEETEQALYNAYDEMPEAVDYEERIITFKAALDALRDPKEDPALQNQLLKACIGRIVYTRKKPERMTKEVAERVKHEGLRNENGWTSPPIELDVQLKV